MCNTCFSDPAAAVASTIASPSDSANCRCAASRFTNASSWCRNRVATASAAAAALADLAAAARREAASASAAFSRASNVSSSSLVARSCPSSDEMCDCRRLRSDDVVARSWAVSSSRRRNSSHWVRRRLTSSRRTDSSAVTRSWR